MAAPIPYDWSVPFVAALREYPVLAHGARAAGVDYMTAWNRKQKDPEFAERVRVAMEEGIDRAEKEAFRRAVAGFEEPVVHQGQLTPVYERDAQGMIVQRERRRIVGGKEVIDMVPVQSTDADGRPVWLTVRKHSDAMLGLVLKARRKSYSTERTEVTSPDGSMSPTDESARAARVAQLMAAAVARKHSDALGASDDPDYSDLA